MNSKIKQLFGILMVLNIASCGILPANATAPKSYLLDIPFESLSPPNPQGKVLLVSMPQATAGYNTVGLMYTRTPYVLEYYNESQWIDTPAQMLLPLLVHSLDATGQFSAVLSANSAAVSGEWRLDSEIIRLYQDFLSEPSQVHFILRIQLLDMVARNVIATHVFDIKEFAPSQNAEGNVLATNQAVAKVLKELAQFIQAQLPKK